MKLTSNGVAKSIIALPLAAGPALTQEPNVEVIRADDPPRYRLARRRCRLAPGPLDWLVGRPRRPTRCRALRDLLSRLTEDWGR